jgi:probable rRNA maturation factor
VTGGTGDANACPDEPPISIDIDVVVDSGDWDTVAGASALVEAAAAALGREIELEPSQACVALSDDEQVEALNTNYRGKAKPTNVLSFPAAQSAHASDDVRFLGDIVLALETLRREAEEQGIPVEHHLQHLVVHGLLHLLGHDHETDAEAEVMERLEVRILAHLGIPDPYGESRT